MLVSIYSNKSLIYLFIYSIFKFIVYIALTNYFSSFLPTLYVILISKIFTFILYKIKNKIQSIENNGNNSIGGNNNRELLIDLLLPNNNVIEIGNEGHIHIRRRKLINWAIVFILSVLELIFYTMFNKIYEEDPNRRGNYYLLNNKLFFLSILTFLYVGIFKKYNNKHNILAIAILALSQICVYSINYIYIYQNSLFLLYTFFMNVIYSIQHFFEKKLIIINDNHEKNTMYIASEEGVIELIIAIILTIAVKWYFGAVPTMPSLHDYTLMAKICFMALCVLLTEFIRLDTLNKYNPFYICFFEEIIYISFCIYNSPGKELTYIIFHLINIFALLVFIEVIELNFCGLNQKTERFLRERELELINQMIDGMGNSSSLSTGSNSGGNNDMNDNQIHNQVQNHEIILNDDINFDIFNNNENNNIINGSGEEIFDENQKDNIIKNEIYNDINIGNILDDDE